MRSMHQSHRKFELDFTDERVTPMAGLAFVAQAAHRLGLLTALDSVALCQQRDRGASDQENVLALLGCLTAEVETHGYVPLFLDGTCIEVYGKQFEGAARTFGDTNQYWMWGAFLGVLASRRSVSDGT